MERGYTASLRTPKSRTPYFCFVGEGDDALSAYESLHRLVAEAVGMLSEWLTDGSDAPETIVLATENGSEDAGNSGTGSDDGIFGE